MTTKTKSRLKCPDCGGTIRITNSKLISNTYKKTYGDCQDDDCGGRYVFETTPILVLTPSQKPNPTINLPHAKNVAAS